MRIKKLNNSNVLQRREPLAVAKLWRFSNSGMESGPVQFYRHRQGPVPGIRRLKNCRLFRRPRTTNERRAHFSNKATKEIFESHGVTFKLRRKRNANMLPTSWDDISRLYERNWKRYRRTQRKDAGGINRQFHGPAFWDW